MNMHYEDYITAVQLQELNVLQYFHIFRELDLSQFCKFYHNLKNRHLKAPGNYKVNYLF